MFSSGHHVNHLRLYEYESTHIIDPKNDKALNLDLKPKQYIAKKKLHENKKEDEYTNGFHFGVTYHFSIIVPYETHW